jgi:hypothetical protein
MHAYNLSYNAIPYSMFALLARQFLGSFEKDVKEGVLLDTPIYRR